ncbi:Protein FAM184A [Hondaea fermentalgiana]|uniref:Protein FAM184A n=1 Tax=Hondaea fermentalgiana TaxID=2315210 RepID=A0A2R5GKR6_9STRA|nr:Protein FAM184A [Hondaea fermentalgiana]|eukprot:GBG31470.1 Protein FAM184A [Hondaea fermentalgiana]
MADPNLHLKLCKKIAQLTKVIYHLNTKNEDHEASLKALSEQHESELHDAMEDAASKIRQLKTALESRSNADVPQEKLKLVESRFEEERERGLREFEAYKTKVAAKEDNLRAEFKSRVTSMQRELDEAKEGFRKRIEEWEMRAAEVASKTDKSDKAALAKMRKAHENAIAKLEAAHAQELEERRVAAEALQTNLEAAQRAAAGAEKRAQEGIAKARQEALQREEELLREKDSVVQGVRSEVESTESTLLSRISYLSASIEAEQKATQTAVAALEERSQELDALRGTHESALQEARRAAEDAAATNSAISRDLERARNELLQAREATTTVETQLHELQAFVESEKQSRRRVESSAENANEQILSLERKLKEQTRLGSQHVRELQDKLSSREREVRKLQADAAEASGKLSSFSDLLAGERERVTVLKTELATIASGKSQQAQEMDLQRIELSKAEAKIVEAGIEADALREALASAKANLDAANQAHIAERNAIQEAHAVAIAQASREARATQGAHKEALDTLRESLASENARRETQIHKEHSALVAKLENAKIAELQALESGFLEKLRDQATARERAEAISGKLRADLDAAKATIDELSEAKEKSGASLESAMRKRNDLETELRAANTMISSLEATAARDLQHHKETLQERERDAQARISVAVAEQKQRDEETLALARAELQASAAKEVAALKEELAGVKQEASASNTEGARLRRDLDALREHHEAQLEIFSQKQQRMVQDLRQEAVAKLAAEQDAWRAKLEEAEKSLLTERESALRKLETRHVEKERALRKEAEQSKQAALDGLRAALQHEAAIGRTHLETAHRAALDALRQNLGQQRSAAEKQLRDAHAVAEKNLQERLAAVEETRNRLETRVQSLEKELEQAKIHFDDKVTALEQDRSREQKRHEVHLETLRRAHDDQVRTLNASHANDVHSLEGERDRIRKALESDVANLQKTIAYWEHRYEHREPRVEDTKQIAKLNKKLEHAETKVRHAVEEMQFYKLELRNREESYNKVFNRNVNVGVMQVLKPSAPSVGTAAPRSTVAFGAYGDDDDNGSERSRRRSKKKKDKDKDREKDKDRSSRKHKSKHRSSSSSQHQHQHQQPHEHASDGIEFPPLDNHSLASTTNERPMSNQAATRYSSRSNATPESRPELALDDDDHDEDDRARGDRDAAQLLQGSGPKRRIQLHQQQHRRIIHNM